MTAFLLFIGFADRPRLLGTLLCNIMYVSVLFIVAGITSLPAILRDFS